MQRVFETRDGTNQRECLHDLRVSHSNAIGGHPAKVDPIDLPPVLWTRIVWGLGCPGEE